MTDTYVHSSGTTATLVHTAPIVEETQYQLSYTITGRTAGTITITFGGATSGAVSASGLLVLTTALSVSRFTVSPTADFDGTCTFSLRVITNYSDACQWDNLIGCYEDCGGEEIYSPGLWTGSDGNCPGSHLEVSLCSEYYVSSEFASEEGEHLGWIDSDQALYGIVEEITGSVPKSGGGYVNEFTYVDQLPEREGELGNFSIIGFSAADYNLATPFTFSVSAVQLKTYPKRTFEPINCFVLGGSQCI